VSEADVLEQLVLVLLSLLGLYPEESSSDLYVANACNCC
jgi:hypothetical protein